ncbi:acyl-CoA thioesterase II [Leucobacter sp. UCMA 4100]|uniref:acyl-CoA thioesterase n=1 Tax=Leucobacter sp. UCMA 4100 TaxID=2810534 RepID=UPI0022EB8164|nr:acyl-CoA thioesterase II [Leucobacter sp. UCMA 4100]MDA3148126.1 acyl-CoA thioesterase II [Leucobacter sp. UCMA 4100]
MLAGVPNLGDMLAVIDLDARTRYDVFTGPALPTPHGRAFGGQVLGQAIAAASETLPEGRKIHSMHGYFVRPGDSEKRMTFEVARLHDGRTYSTRRTQAYQNGEVLMSMISSFQDDSAGVEHQDSIDITQFPEPESIPSIWDRYGHLTLDRQASWILNRPFDFRHVEGDIVLNVPENRSTQHVWLRSRNDMPGPHSFQCAALAFASDYLLMEPVMRKHGIPWATPGMKGASLDHAMWFHRPFRVDEWLLYEITSPTAQSGRGLSHGRFFNMSGELVASVSQETAVRLPEE